jgi:hypothetical protein
MRLKVHNLNSRPSPDRPARLGKTPSTSPCSPCRQGSTGGGGRGCLVNRRNRRPSRLSGDRARGGRAAAPSSGRTPRKGRGSDRAPARFEELQKMISGEGIVKFTSTTNGLRCARPALKTYIRGRRKVPRPPASLREHIQQEAQALVTRTSADTSGSPPAAQTSVYAQ